MLVYETPKFKNKFYLWERYRSFLFVIFVLLKFHTWNYLLMKFTSWWGDRFCNHFSIECLLRKCFFVCFHLVNAIVTFFRIFKLATKIIVLVATFTYNHFFMTKMWKLLMKGLTADLSLSAIARVLYLCFRNSFPVSLSLKLKSVTLCWFKFVYPSYSLVYHLVN